MNIKSLLIAAVALTMGLSACNKEEDLTQQDGVPANAVRITATVGNPFATTRSNPVGTVEEQKKFNSGDKIRVFNSFDENGMAQFESGVVYQFNGTEWLSVDNQHLLWENNLDEDDQRFAAIYPHTETIEELIYPTIDQSSFDNLAFADVMISEIYASKGTTLNFVMERQTSLLNFKIVGFNSEFSDNSKVTDLNVIMANSPDEPFIPYSPEGTDGSIGSTYTLISGPMMMERYIYINLKVGNKEMRTPILPKTEPGKSYTFNLAVGKDKLEIESVTVEDWTTKDILIPGGEAEEDLGS